MTPDVRVEPLSGDALLDSPHLSAIQFGFEPPDQIPPWFVHTFAAFGGIALGAFHDERLVGYSYGMPGYDEGETFLLACGLAVHPAFESNRVGERLKLAQRDHARAAGYSSIRWTTGSLASRQLYLYLTKLGARLVRLHEDFYATTQETEVFPDEVEVAWQICPTAPAARAGGGEPARPLTTTALIGDGRRRRLVTVDADRADGGACAVEIPWDRHAIAHDPDLAFGWHDGVRAAMRQLLDAGYEGTYVDLDRREQRPYVRFEPRQQPATKPVDAALSAPERTPDASISAAAG